MKSQNRKAIEKLEENDSTIRSKEKLLERKMEERGAQVEKEDRRDEDKGNLNETTDCSAQVRELRKYGENEKKRLGSSQKMQSGIEGFEGSTGGFSGLSTEAAALWPGCAERNGKAQVQRIR